MSSSSGSDEAGPSTGVTTPSPGSLSPSHKVGQEGETTVEALDEDESYYSKEYGKDLPSVPEAGKVEPLAIDASTPDAWIARDERM